MRASTIFVSFSLFVLACNLIEEKQAVESPTRLDLSRIKSCATPGITSFDMDSLIDRPDTLTHREVEILGQIEINQAPIGT